jgi:hypothetical protein
VRTLHSNYALHCPINTATRASEILSTVPFILTMPTNVQNLNIKSVTSSSGPEDEHFFGGPLNLCGSRERGIFMLVGGGGGDLQYIVIHCRLNLNSKNLYVAKSGFIKLHISFVFIPQTKC